MVLLGNIIALIASLVALYAGILKNKKQILYTQSIQLLLMAICDFILGGITGAITNLLGIIRNILCYNNKLSKLYIIIITLVMVVLSLCFDTFSIISILPLICVTSYNFLMNTNSIIKFKVLIIYSFILWFIYDISIKSYVSATFDFLNIIANLVSILQIKVNKSRS